MKQLLAAAFLLLPLQAAAAEPAGFQSVTIPQSITGARCPARSGIPPATAAKRFPTARTPSFSAPRFSTAPGWRRGPFPVILASHGLGGNIGALSWLTAGLAEAGALVISVNHPNSTTRDFNLQEGLEALDADAGPSGRARLARRPAGSCGASGLLPSLRDRLLRRRLDSACPWWPARRLPGICRPLRDRAPSPWQCADLARRGADLTTYSLGEWDASRKDDRIRAVAAIDPALTYGLGSDHARDLVERVLLIGLGTRRPGCRRPISARWGAGSPPICRPPRSRP